MAHFMCGCRGNRGEATRLAGKDAAPRAFVQGWHSGVEVVGGSDEKGDYFHVYGTFGSGRRNSSVLLGTVRVTAKGPRLVRPKRPKAEPTSSAVAPVA